MTVENITITQRINMETSRLVLTANCDKLWTIDHEDGYRKIKIERGQLLKRRRIASDEQTPLRSDELRRYLAFPLVEHGTWKLITGDSIISTSLYNFPSSDFNTLIVVGIVVEDSKICQIAISSEEMKNRVRRQYDATKGFYLINRKNSDPDKKTGFFIHDAREEDRASVHDIYKDTLIEVIDRRGRTLLLEAQSVMHFYDLVTPVGGWKRSTLIPEKTTRNVLQGMY